MGHIYEALNNIESAFSTYKLSIDICVEIGDKNGESNACNPLSGLYLNNGDIEMAKSLIERSIKLKTETNDIRGLGYSYYGKAKILDKLGENQSAFDYYNISLKTHTANGDFLGVGLVKLKLGSLELRLKNYSVAEKYLNEAIGASVKSGNFEIKFKAYLLLSIAGRIKGNFKKALEYYELYHKTKEKVISAETSGKIRTIELEHKAELIERENKVQKEKNIELEKINSLLADKNLQIMQSLNYAKKIQTAILPTKKYLKDVFEDFFIFHKPKDIVSGDFYWVYKTLTNKVVWAVADCTGHGVPGAFMSVMGASFLNDIVIENKIQSPDSILNALRDKISSSFTSEKESMFTRDGMDISVCVFDTKNMVLQYAGANNSLIIIRKGELIELPPDKMPVGYSEINKKFKKIIFALEKGDALYSFTDGFIDQFGGEKNKKFKTSAFRRLLIYARNNSMKNQYFVLREALSNWMGDNEQVDDILVFGVKI